MQRHSAKHASLAVRGEVNACAADLVLHGMRSFFTTASLARNTHVTYVPTNDRNARNGQLMHRMAKYPLVHVYSIVLSQVAMILSFSGMISL